MEIDLEVSKEKDVNEQVISSKDKERNKENEGNNTSNVQENHTELE